MKKAVIGVSVAAAVIGGFFYFVWCRYCRGAKQ